MDAVPKERIGVIGLGYVGLPVAVALAHRFPGTVGFDIDGRRIGQLRDGTDSTGEVSSTELTRSGLSVTDDLEPLRGCTAFIVAVPTPIDADRRPDLAPLHSACRTVGQVVTPGAVVVFESTVYPGLTEEVCGPLIAQVSGLEQGRDFKLGYSPERINPGDREHRFDTIVKVVSADDPATLDRLCAIYGPVVQAGLHRAPSIRVAEAAKVLENTQRDLNIALMNELAIICDRLGIATRDVLEAARTKWNFLPFTPGLVGGHCIGVDPYYLTTRAQALGYHPEVILAGRRINDGMGAYVAQRLVKTLIHNHRQINGARIGVLGITFKEDVPDLRNSRVPDILQELDSYGATCLVHDPLADAAFTREAYGVDLVPWEALDRLDALILAVPHRAFRERDPATLVAGVEAGGVVVDIKSALDRRDVAEGLTYWSL